MPKRALDSALLSDTGNGELAPVLPSPFETLTLGEEYPAWVAAQNAATDAHGVWSDELRAW